MLVRTLILGFMGLYLGACVSNLPNAPLPIEPFDNQVSVEKLWRIRVGDTNPHQHYKHYFVVIDDQFFVANRYSVMGIQGDDIIWEKTFQHELTGALGYANQLLFVADEKGHIYALNITDGSEQWQHQIPSEILVPPQSDGSTVVVVTNDGYIHGLQHDNGQVLWQFSTVKPILQLTGSAPPTLHEGITYIGQDNGKVLAIDNAAGIRMWEERIALPQGESELDRLVDIDGAPLVHSNAVFAASFQGNIGRIDPQRGRAVWLRAFSTFLPLAANGGVLVGIDTDGVITAFNPFNGEQIWQNDKLKYRQLSAPIVTSAWVLTSDEKGQLFFISRNQGTLIGLQKISPGRITQPLQLIDDTLYFIDAREHLTAYRINP